MPDSCENPEDHEHDEFEGFDMDELQKNFKALADELDENSGKSLNQIMVEAEQKEKTAVQPVEIPYYRGYDPDISDFLARAQSEEECKEIIDYCLNKGDITQAEADNLLDRLKKGGPRAFGTRKPGYYDQML